MIVLHFPLYIIICLEIIPTIIVNVHRHDINGIFDNEHRQGNRSVDERYTICPRIWMYGRGFPQRTGAMDKHALRFIKKIHKKNKQKNPPTQWSSWMERSCAAMMQPIFLQIHTTDTPLESDTLRVYFVSTESNFCDAAVISVQYTTTHYVRPRHNGTPLAFLLHCWMWYMMRLFLLT